jgi:uncharacterized membrane protein YgcG
MRLVFASPVLLSAKAYSPERSPGCGWVVVVVLVVVVVVVVGGAVVAVRVVVVVVVAFGSVVVVVVVAFGSVVVVVGPARAAPASASHHTTDHASDRIFIGRRTPANAISDLL